MDLKLSGKIAVVTAASKGIGLAITHTLRDEGAKVVAGARNTRSLEGLSGVTPMDVDLSTAQGPARLVEAALAEHGRVDVLVNNMGGVRLRLLASERTANVTGTNFIIDGGLIKTL